MAQIGTAPAASRYNGLSSGQRFIYSFETQEGIPVDGGNALLRDMSPFTIRILPPDALLAASVSPTGTTSTDTNVNLITSVAQNLGTSTSDPTTASALGRSTLIGQSSFVIDTLKASVADGTLLTNQGSATPAISNLAVIADITLQLQTILSISPLTLLVNPDNFTISYTKIQNYSTRTRFGYVFEAWGEEQPTISFSGSTGAFIAAAASGTLAQVTGRTESVSGMQYASKRDSAAWQNFMSLYQFYRNNGYIFDTTGASEAHLFIGHIAIDYDQWTYVGQFNSFSYKYEEGQPHRVTFDMDFQVNRMYDWASQSTSVSPLSAPTVSLSDPKYAPGRGGTSPGALDPFGGSDNQSSFADRLSQIPFELLGE